MEKKINLGVLDRQKLFRAYVEILQPILNLRKREADVFAQLLFYNNKKKSIPDDVDRFELIFSTKFRKQIASNLGIKDSVLQNCLSELRKKKLVSTENHITKGYLVYPDDKGFAVTFNLNIDENR